MKRQNLLFAALITVVLLAVASPSRADQAAAGSSASALDSLSISRPVATADGGAVRSAEEVPDCPAVRTCAGGNSCSTFPGACQITELISDVDTGSSSCVRGGSPIQCLFPGETIHVLTFSCGQCPCCTQVPYACICPLDCGQAVQLTCA